jgi:ferritin
MMISKKMAGKLNDQVKNEFESYWIYLAMAYSLESMNLKVFAAWFHQQAEEEKVHAMKFAKYLIDQGAEVVLESLPKPKSAYKSVKEICQGAVDHEIKITNDINNVMTLAKAEKDYATETFLDWFVNEQVEEVASTTELLNLVSLATRPEQLLMLESRIKRD